MWTLALKSRLTKLQSIEPHWLGIKYRTGRGADRGQGNRIDGYEWMGRGYS